MSNQLVQQKEDEKEDLISSIPVCAANLSTPVVDRAYYINEIQYRIGGRIYIENAD
ncbi:MAG TPA: hypothetical protein VE378_03560 [Nitrososphaeraceae archaeon]|nr:hypothetical protein [Nitrososphaeraceae archaeon]